MVTEDWRKKPRRRLRSAPKERPLVPVAAGFRSRVEGIVGGALAASVLGILDGALPGTPKQFHELEKRLLDLARVEVVAPLLVEVVKEVHCDESFVVWCMADVRRRGADLRSAGERDVTIRIAGGAETTVRTPYMEPKTPRSKPGPRRKPGKRGKGGGGLFPVLAVLGFLSRVSPYVASEVARCSEELASYEEAAGTLKRQGLDLHPDTVRRIACRVADAGLSERERTEPIDPDFFDGKRVVLCADGGRIRCRLEKSGRRRSSGFHGYNTPWQEPKVFAAYTIDDEGEKLPEELPIYEGTLAPWRDAVATVANTLKRFGIAKAARVAIAADGSENIWREIDRLIELAGIDRAKVVFFLDFYHAAEHLSDAAKLSRKFQTDAERQRWVTKQAKRLEAGGIERVLLDLNELPARRGAAKDLRKERAYFSSRVELMRYDLLRQEGLPIGTGAVESAIRRIVNLRMKNPGTFWKPENAERMLYLRTRGKAGRWAEVEAAMHRAALLPERDTRPAILDSVAA